MKYMIVSAKEGMNIDLLFEMMGGDCVKLLKEKEQRIDNDDPLEKSQEIAENFKINLGNDIKILVNEKRINIKDSKHISNNNSNILNSNNHKFYYTKYLSNNHQSNNSNIIHHHIKNPTANNININGVRKIIVRPKDVRKINVNHTKISSKPIPTPSQKIKGNLIPSQRNIKINLAKFLQGVKTKQNNKPKDILGRKSFSIKKLANENNSDFSLPHFNYKLSNKLLRKKV